MVPGCVPFKIASDSPTLHSRWLLFSKVMIISLWNLVQYHSIVRWAMQAQCDEPLVFHIFPIFSLFSCVFQIFSLFDILIFHIFQIISLFNLSFLHIFSMFFSYQKQALSVMISPLQFSQFSGCWLILYVYIIMSFDFPIVRLFGVR
jgi:hypothetical protein